MRSLGKFLMAFLVISVAVAVTTGGLGIQFEHANYWNYHGLIFLFAIAAFPRLTLLLSSVPFGGLLWWLGWLFSPRLLVAVLATFAYWYENPVIVVIAWLFAVGGESSEKFVVVKRARQAGEARRKGFAAAKWV